MERLLETLLRRVVVDGALKVTTASGRTFTVKGSPRAGPMPEPLAVRFTSAEAERGIVLDPELKLGEAYMDGTLVMDAGSIADLLALLMSQPASFNPSVPAKAFHVLRRLGRRIAQFNPPERSRRNVAHH